MSEIRTVEQAKEASLKKWNEILDVIERLDVIWENPCGFCLLSEIERINSDIGTMTLCDHCLVTDKCKELVSGKFSDTLTKLKGITFEITDYIELFKEDD